MKNLSSTRRRSLAFICALFFVLSIYAARAAAQTPKAQPQSTQARAASQSAPALNYIFGWARVLTTVVDLDKLSQPISNRAYYSNIVALPKTADASALQGQVQTYFTQLGVPDAMRVNEKVQVKGAMVKTFPTLVEADNARYAMATQDMDQLNANAEREVALPVSYFTWNYYGSRKDLFPDISDFVTTGYDPQWEFVVFEVTAEKPSGGEEPLRETRYYVSYPYELFMSGRESINRTKHVDSYFTKTTVEPAAQRGVKLDYYDNEIEFFSSYKTFAEAWAAREKKLDVIKSNGYPQYDFLLISNGPNKGEATSYPFCATGCTGERARITSLEMKAVTKKP